MNRRDALKTTIMAGVTAALGEQTAETNETPKEQINMGSGEKGSPKSIFVRKFRWVLSGDGLSSSFMHNVKFNFHERWVSFGVYEVYPHLEEIDLWLRKCVNNENENVIIDRHFNKEQLIFTTYDRCGIPLYAYTLTGLTITNDEVEFDYGSDDCSVRQIKLAYRKIKKGYADGPEVTALKKQKQ